MAKNQNKGLFVAKRARRSGGGYSVGGVFATRADWLTEYRVGLERYIEASFPRFMQCVAQGER